VNPLPFDMSSEALAWIDTNLSRAARHPHFPAGAVPCLSAVHNYRKMDRDGRVIERYLNEFVQLGWDDPARLAAAGATELELCRWKVWVSASNLAALAGKRLMVESVPVGVPRPEDKFVKLLKAV
jgi:hypothetical protein